LSRACFGRIIACDPYIDERDFPDYVQSVDPATLYRTADVLSLHVPLNPETRGMVNAAAFASMKAGAILVNTARGGVVDIDALVEALRGGRLQSAGLDVLPHEPMPAGHPVMNDPRVILTPHSAFYSVEGERELRRKAAQNLVDWALTGRPTYVVVEGR
jgi:D-3-phosphoglycerate dehydrogenase